MSARGARPPVVLALAGHDPTGGAGVDADAEAIRAAGAEPVCVVTNRTEQDGRRVFGVAPVALEQWCAEARAAFDAHAPAALKTGLVSSAEQVDAIADLVLEQRARRPELVVVVDPVLAASGGEVFLDAAGRARLVARLADLRAVLTPNVPELAALSGADEGALAADPRARVDAARGLLARGAAAVVVKGGHGREDPVVDLWVADAAVERCERRRLVGRGIHGSGCRFASHLAARLALGEGAAAALATSGAFLAARIAAAPSCAGAATEPRPDRRGAGSRESRRGGA